jgi:hypothetical protein
MLMEVAVLSHWFLDLIVHTQDGVQSSCELDLCSLTLVSANVRYDVTSSP